MLIETEKCLIRKNTKYFDSCTNTQNIPPIKRENTNVKKKEQD